MHGRFGVFCDIELLAEFGSDVDADEYMRVDLLQEHLPEHLRAPEYDACDLAVRPVPRNYDFWREALEGARELPGVERVFRDRLRRLVGVTAGDSARV